MQDKEVMPLITCFDGQNPDDDCKCGELTGKICQRNADLKVLEAKKKEWAENEADFWSEWLTDSDPDGELWLDAARWHIAELRQNGRVMPEREVIPTEAQLEADLEVLEAERAWMENAWRNYLEAQRKEWANSMADWLENNFVKAKMVRLGQHEYHEIVSKIAQLRQEAEETSGNL